MDAIAERNSYEELIRENLEVDILFQRQGYQEERVNEIIEIMLDAICSKNPTIRVNNTDTPQEVVKSRLLKLNSSHIEYTALIGYIWYEAPDHEKNFATLLEMINASEAREDDENFKNQVDIMFDELEARDSDHFAVKQYRKYKLSAGVICFRRLLYRHDRKVS